MPYSRCTEHPPATACALGPLDAAHAPEDRRMLLASLDGRESLLIDMSGVTRMDSAGLANLVEACHAARMRGKGFALTRVNEPVMRMIKLAGWTGPSAFWGRGPRGRTAGRPSPDRHRRDRHEDRKGAFP